MTDHDSVCAASRFYRGLDSETIDRLPDGYEYPCECEPLSHSVPPESVAEKV
jgi:hypothetical protein